MKTDIRKRSYNNPNKEGDWTTWTETCDSCGKIIHKVDELMALGDVSKELAEKEDLCLTCLNKKIDEGALL